MDMLGQVVGARGVHLTGSTEKPFNPNEYGWNGFGYFGIGSGIWFTPIYKVVHDLDLGIDIQDWCQLNAQINVGTWLIFMNI